MMPYSVSLSTPISSTIPSPTQSASCWVTSKVWSLLSMIESEIAWLAASSSWPQAVRDSASTATAPMARIFMVGSSP